MPPIQLKYVYYFGPATVNPPPYYRSRPPSDHFPIIQQLTSISHPLWWPRFNAWSLGGFPPVPLPRIVQSIWSLALGPKPPNPKSSAGKTAYHLPLLMSSVDISCPLLMSLPHHLPRHLPRTSADVICPSNKKFPPSFIFVKKKGKKSFLLCSFAYSTPRSPAK